MKKMKRQKWKFIISPVKPIYSLAFKVYLEYVYSIYSYTQPSFVDFLSISGFCSYTDE